MKSTLVLLVTLFSLVHTALAQTFQNTPGLAVISPTNGQTITEDQNLLLSAQFAARRIIGKAKKKRQSVDCLDGEVIESPQLQKA